MGARIRRSAPQDQDELVRCLCESFDDDVVVNFFIRQDARRGAAMKEFFEIAVEKMTMPYGEVYQYEGAKGVALWAPPGKWNLGPLAQVGLFPSMVRIAGWKLLPRVLTGLHVIEQAHLQRPHMYLSFLCARPNERGQGIGSELLAAMLERCDQEGLPVYLENTKAENEHFYIRHGFEVVGQIDLGSGAPKYYAAMIREPRK